MPIYEYQCTNCDHQFEEVQKFSDPTLEDCPSCGQNTAERQVSVSAFHLKGGGWYKDGYSNSKSSESSSDKSESKSSSSSSSSDSSASTSSSSSSSDSSSSSTKAA